MMRLKHILMLCVFGALMVNGQYTSPFNKKTIADDSTGAYSFIVSGHFYGDGGNKSHFPANTLLANLDWINGSNADMLVCLGDLFKDISNDIPNYETSFFNKLEIPLVNAVGNHDLTGTVYQDNYGETSYMFSVNMDLHIVLDTEQDNGDIEGEQLELLKQAREKVNQGIVHNVFIYSHRTVWSNAYDELDGLFKDNTQSLGGTNYKDEVLPILGAMGEKAKVYWFSGSLGTAPASFFRFYDQENNVTIIATAIRALPRDAMLKVYVNPMGEASFETKSLTGQDLMSLESYDVEFWQNEVGEEPFNWKLIPYYMELALTHRFFWYGFFTAVFFGAIIAFYIRRKRKKNRSD